jgi:hypothetical protein
MTLATLFSMMARIRRRYERNLPFDIDNNVDLKNPS